MVLLRLHGAKCVAFGILFGVPGLYLIAVALFLILLAAPQFKEFRDDASATVKLRLAALALFVGIGITAYQMFVPHGVVRNAFIATKGNHISQASASMSDAWHNCGRTNTGTRFAPSTQINKDNIKKLHGAWTCQRLAEVS